MWVLANGYTNSSTARATARVYKLTTTAVTSIIRVQEAPSIRQMYDSRQISHQLTR